MEKDVLSPAGNEDVVEPVVVVIADGNPRGPDTTTQSGLRGDVAEGAVAIVAIQLDGRFRGRGAGAAAAGEHHDVQPAVVVVIQESHAASHGFEDVVGLALVAVHDGCTETGRGSDVGEFGVEGTSGGLAAWPRRNSAGGHPPKALCMCGGRQRG